MIARTELLGRIETVLGRSRIVALLGPRQSGKTTLARELAAGRESVIYDLEDPVDAARLALPKEVLASHGGLVVSDGSSESGPTVDIRDSWPRGLLAFRVTARWNSKTSNAAIL